MSDDEHEQKPKVSITLRTIVTGPEAGCIIGRGGDVVNSIRDESGAKVKIEGSSQQERIITVDGPTDSIFKAYTLICKTLEGRERKDGRDRSRDSRDDDLALNLLVPASQCGAIIGKEGCKIKEIRENTGAAIHVSSESLPGRPFSYFYHHHYHQKHPKNLPIVSSNDFLQNPTNFHLQIQIFPNIALK